jgi:hypothetical protein
MVAGSLSRGHTSQNFVALYVTLALLAALKVYLVTGQDIFPGPSDAYGYLRSADYWYWGNAASWARPPSFPLFVTVFSKTGLPLRITFELVYIIASACLAIAMLRLGFPPWSAGLNFGVTLIVPSSILVMNLAMVESMLVSVVILMTAELAYVMTARGSAFWLHSLFLSLLIVIAWFARPETILISGAIASVVILLLSDAIFRRRTIQSAILSSARVFGLPVFALIVTNVGVAGLNGIYFGRFTPVEDLRAPAFVRAYEDLQGIASETPTHYVPVSREQMELAARVSPAFVEIYGALQGKFGDPYRQNSKNYARVDNEIAGGWFIWALRNAVYQAGYRDVAAQDHFYDRLSQELEAAALSKKIAIRRLALAMIDPKVDVWISYLPHSFMAILSQTVPGHLPPLAIWGASYKAVTPEIAGEFDRVNRRTETTIPAPELTARLDKVVAVLESLYRPIMLTMAAFGLVLFAFGGWRRLSLEAASVLVFALVQIIGRVGIFALIDASSYPIHPDTAARYLLPASALLPFLSVCLLAMYFRRSEERPGSPFEILSTKRAIKGGLDG